VHGERFVPGLFFSAILSEHGEYCDVMPEFRERVGEVSGNARDAVHLRRKGIAPNGYFHGIFKAYFIADRLEVRGFVRRRIAEDVVEDFLGVLVFPIFLCLPGSMFFAIFAFARNEDFWECGDVFGLDISW
jgi:hypothetical protein